MATPDAPAADAPPEAEHPAEPNLEELAAQLGASGWKAPDQPTNVIAALARVMLELPGIGKDNESEQGYKYRGIEAITKHAQQLLGRYGVVFVPRVIERVTKEFPINGRPWTEDQATIVYTVYGPGGTTDSIEVGPLIALGRDNSDKGMNKCMTQAFKYALLQVLCVGDHKDDADNEEAHQGDAPQAEVSPERAARIELSGRIRKLSAEARDEVRAFCDDAEIPRVTAQMDDEQLERVTAKVDALEIAAAQDQAAEAGDAPTTHDEDVQPEVTEEQLLRLQELKDALWTSYSAMEGDDLIGACRELGVSIMGSADAKRKRCVDMELMKALAAAADEAEVDANNQPAEEIEADGSAEDTDATVGDGEQPTLDQA